MGPMVETKVVPICPTTLRQELLRRNDDAPSAGPEKTLQRLRQEVYWVNMAHVMLPRQCVTCQRSQATKPVKAPLQSIPIGRPWEMIAMDILEVPMSYHHNKYLLVVQDYFTKWAMAIPIHSCIYHYRAHQTVLHIWSPCSRSLRPGSQF